MRALKFSALLLLLTASAFAGYFLFRNQLLHHYLNKAKSRLEKSELILTTQYAGFSGFSNVIIKEINVTPISGDTILTCKEVAASLSLLQLLRGNLPLEKITITNGKFHYAEYSDSTSNLLGFLNKNSSPPPTDSTSKNNYNTFSRFNSVRNKFNQLKAYNIHVSNFELMWTAPDYKESFFIKQFSLDDSGYIIDAYDRLEESVNSFQITGIVNASSGMITFNGDAANGSLLRLPFAGKFAKLNFFTRKASGEIRIVNETGTEIEIKLSGNAVSPGVNHWRISPEDVLLDSITADLNITFGSKSFKINEPSFLQINNLPIQFNASFENTDETIIKANAHFSDVPSQDFFNSLPKGLFNTLEGIETSGTLSYRLEVDVNMDDPDSLIFNSELKGDEFKIVKYGAENFAAINSDFIYSASEDDRVKRKVLVGLENPYFTPLNQISPLLINSVLTAEDGMFYFNKGFNKSAFRRSIATNIKEKRFARGGSTITMQLVKNVFLNRNKNVARKIEEALIVWLIENQRLVTKDRMLEVYLNIIEWGPNIYGIGEAAEFYFLKKPMQLNLEESIYLSSIIPRPKYFKYSFEKDGTLKEYLKSYFNVVGERLLGKEIITATEFENMSFQVELKGPAMNMVIPQDTSITDSLFIEQPVEFY